MIHIDSEEETIMVVGEVGLLVAEALSVFFSLTNEVKKQDEEQIEELIIILEKSKPEFDSFIKDLKDEKTKRSTTGFTGLKKEK